MIGDVLAVSKQHKRFSMVHFPLVEEKKAIAYNNIGNGISRFFRLILFPSGSAAISPKE